MFLLTLAKVLDDAKVPFALAGGYAVSLHGAVRSTLDVDVVIKHSERNFVSFSDALLKLNLISRIPVTAQEVFRFRKEYIQNRNLIAWSFTNSQRPSEIVDLLLPYDLADLRTKKVTVNGVVLKIVSLKDLIRMKQEANRPQDREDISALRKLL